MDRRPLLPHPPVAATKSRSEPRRIPFWLGLRAGASPPTITLSFKVVRQCRQNVPHASARIVHVARVSWDEVDVQVRHGLARRCTDVDADVESIGRVSSLDHSAGHLKVIDQRPPLVARRGKPVCDMAAGYQ